jgi:SAM-dependent methyltransferase
MIATMSLQQNGNCLSIPLKIPVDAVATRVTQMIKYFDKRNNRVICVENAATPAFWDAHWDSDRLRSEIVGSQASWIVRKTKAFLPLQSRVLEGGCGLGNQVLALMRGGYQAVGVDFAVNTVEYLQRERPEIDIRLGDVRDLPFPAGEFDGYWSLGVIEHFWGGYDKIAEEMARVLRKGGYLFLTFPTMSFIRKEKAKRGKYRPWDGADVEPDGFYQYILDPTDVVKRFQSLGFQLAGKSVYDGLKGCKDEVSFMAHPLQLLYDSPLLFAKALRRALEMVLLGGFGHMQLLVLRKQ